MKIDEALCFDDVLLAPRYYDGKSRSEVDLSTIVSGLNLSLPVVSANMPSVTGPKMAWELSRAGGLGILDRMGTLEHQIESLIEFGELKNSLDESNRLIGASIGIGEDAMKNAKALIEQGANLICIDVAHAAQPAVIQLYEKFREKYPKFPLIIGNFAVPPFHLSQFDLIQPWQNDKFLTLKVGVGGGSQCITRIQTGCGLPTLQSVFEFAEKWEGKIIADGGIKNSGDIVKALAAGSSAVMLGSLLSGHEESPGPVIKVKGEKYKVYRGNASFGTKAGQTNRVSHVEGEESLVPFRGPVAKTLKQLSEGMRSGFSYCGAKKLSVLQLNASFMKISSMGHHESKPHGA